MEGRNTSQDPNYVGPTGHEKAVHKTHFTVPYLPWKHNKIYLDNENLLACECGWKGTVLVTPNNIHESAHNEYDEHKKRQTAAVRGGDGK